MTAPKRRDDDKRRTLATLLLVLTTLASLPTLATAFKAADFKTCATSSFCARHRDRASSDRGAYRVAAGGFAISGDADPEKFDVNVATADLLRDGEDEEEASSSTSSSSTAPLRLRISAYDKGVVRVRVEDPSAPRYEVPDVVLPELETDGAMGFSSVERAEDGSRTTLTLSRMIIPIKETPVGSEVKVVIEHAPVKITTLVDGVEAVVFNANGAFEFERRKTKSEEDAPPPEPSPEVVGDGAPEATPPPEPEVTSYAETFNSHTDSRPNGPMALSFDITFPDASHAYGLPERATTMSLRETKAADGAIATEPYRLYNLDVFEYEHDSPFGLYGSIPMLLGHSVGASEGDGGGGGGWGGLGGGGGGKKRKESRPPRVHGVYFNNPTELYVDVTKGGSSGGISSHWMAESGAFDLFIFPGPSPRETMRQYSMITGGTAMPPAFALGYHQCRWNYRDEADVAAVDAGFDEHDIPYDVLWLDIEHTDGKRYMTWDGATFPTPRRMIEDVASRGRKMVTIVDPHVKKDANYPVYKEAESKGLFVKQKDGVGDFDGWCWPGSSAYLDVTSPAVRAWWADKFSLKNYQGSTKDLYIWNDMNEPSVFNGPEITMQKDLIHHGNVEHREVHNAFGMYYHAATAAGIEKRNDGERPFVLSRAFFAGTQRVGPIWTGDNAADWNHLRVSLPMVLTLGATGLAFSGADVGGFFGNPDGELMTRWYQTGIYYPFFRGHAHLDTKRREPWLFGEPYTALIRAAIRRRYQLMPYLYTLFEEAHRDGAPVMRPLWYEFPNDPHAAAKEDAFMLGPALLVHPVTTQGASSVEVYLPAGVWYDYDTNEMHAGPKTFSVAVTLADTPTFVRGGHVIVRKDRARRSTRAMTHDPFTIVVAPDESGKYAYGEVYLDDGKSYAFEEKDAFSRRQIIFEDGDSLVCAAKWRGGSWGWTTHDAEQKHLEGDPLAFPEIAAEVERVIVLGPRRFGEDAEVRNKRKEIHLVSASGKEGSPAAATAVKKPGVVLAQDWSILFSVAD